MRATNQNGFMLLGALLVLAVLAIVSATSLQLGDRISRAAAEREMYQIGLAYEAALVSYRSHSPDQLAGPESLDQLLWDTRSTPGKRHLRRIYFDPLTGTPTWGLIRDTNNAITGVYSLAAGVPIQQGLFDEAHRHFSNATSYQQWVFNAP